MSNRTEKAIVRAGALDRAEALLTEAKQALDKALVEVGNIDAGETYNDIVRATNAVDKALDAFPDL